MVLGVVSGEARERRDPLGFHREKGGLDSGRARGISDAELTGHVARPSWAAFPVLPPATCGTLGKPLPSSSSFLTRGRSSDDKDDPPLLSGFRST